MARVLLRLSAKLVMGAALLYGVFFVEVGGFTLYEHGARIAATREARDLRAGMSGVLDGVAGVLSDGVHGELESSAQRLSR